MSGSGSCTGTLPPFQDHLGSRPRVSVIRERGGRATLCRLPPIQKQRARLAWLLHGLARSGRR